jgi:hypothetical protein
MILSFLAGVFGYIIARFWIIPIRRYQRSKTELTTQLKEWWTKLPPESAQGQPARPGKKRLDILQRQSAALVVLHDVDLPYWYRLVLMTRKESAQAASEALSGMQNVTSSGQARQLLEAASRHLGTEIA